MNYLHWICVLVLCILVVYCVYLMIFYAFNGDDIKRDTELWIEKLQDDKLQTLLNGSGINNIPNLNIISTNTQVTTANDCQNAPVYIGARGNKNDCVLTCLNSSANVINVGEDETYIYDSIILHRGAYCIIGPRPRCNMKTTYALMTVNSVVCRSRYPQIIGGDLGTEVVACNNRLISDPRNILWDYANNERFSPYSTQFTDPDERLSDGSYRFACKFDGLDSRQNKYIAHPQNRFHPIQNYCAALVYRAHPDIQTTFDLDKQTFKCDCGQFEETRVQNIDPGNDQSQCSQLVVLDRPIVRNKRELTVPYKCFTLYSPLSDVGRYLPCPNEQFTREGDQMATVTIPYTFKLEDVIEHPQYADMTNATVGVYDTQIN